MDRPSGMNLSFRPSTLARVYGQETRYQSAIIAYDCALSSGTLERDGIRAFASCLERQGLHSLLASFLRDMSPFQSHAHVANRRLDNPNRGSSWNHQMDVEAAWKLTDWSAGSRVEGNSFAESFPSSAPPLPLPLPLPLLSLPLFIYSYSSSSSYPSQYSQASQLVGMSMHGNEYTPDATLSTFGERMQLGRGMHSHIYRCLQSIANHSSDRAFSQIAISRRAIAKGHTLPLQNHGDAAQRREKLFSFLVFLRDAEEVLRDREIVQHYPGATLSMMFCRGTIALMMKSSFYRRGYPCCWRGTWYQMPCST